MLKNGLRTIADHFLHFRSCKEKLPLNNNRFLHQVFSVCFPVDSAFRFPEHSIEQDVVVTDGFRHRVISVDPGEGRNEGGGAVVLVEGRNVVVVEILMVVHVVQFLVLHLIRQKVVWPLSKQESFFLLLNQEFKYFNIV